MASASEFQSRCGDTQAHGIMRYVLGEPPSGNKYANVRTAFDSRCRCQCQCAEGDSRLQRMRRSYPIGWASLAPNTVNPLYKGFDCAGAPLHRAYEPTTCVARTQHGG